MRTWNEDMPIQASPATASTVARPSLAATLVDGLLQLGVRQAFGVSGGAMAALWHAMSASRLRVCHFRHESGAAFAATETHFATSRPVLVFSTTGPGLTNALTGLLAARGEGAKLILVSAYSSAQSRGRGAIQETSQLTMPHGLYASGPLFHFARVLEAPNELPCVMHELALGLARRGAFIAHLALPTAVQSMPAARFALGAAPLADDSAAPTPAALQACVRALADEPFAIWLGFGARGAADEVRALAERSGAAVFCTPRGKGILSETHAQFIGVTGIGGHESVAAWVATQRPARILVLGSRLGEASSLFDPRLVPRRGFVHVDVDPEVAGVAYPDAPTLPIVADVGALLRGLLARLPAQSAQRPALPCAPPGIAATTLASSSRVRPEALMDAIQHHVVDASDATLLAESGNAFVWTTHRLRFATPGRYRVSTGFGAMGHAACGVVGVALAGRGRAVALVGDGSMLMHNEVNTAVKYAAAAVWIVLNDGRYGMCAQGMEALGLSADALFPAVDFVAYARAQGADGVRVQHEHELAAALRQAMRASGPFVVDVLIDAQARAPSGCRNRGLARQLGEADAGDVAFSMHKLPSPARTEPVEALVPVRAGTSTCLWS